MNRTIKLGEFAGLKWLMRGTAVIGTALLWSIFAVIGVVWSDLPFGQAIVGGFIAAMLYWVGEIVHQLGHAWAARRTGYPMSGVLAFWVLGTSLYPKDEPEIAAKLHIQRALGGPISSFLFSIVAGVLVLLVGSNGGLLHWLVGFLFWMNFLFFTVGAFLPLGFTDGSTILKYWGQR